MSGVVRLRPADRDLALSVVRKNLAENVFINHRLQNPPANRLVDGEIFATTNDNPALLYIGGNAVPANLDTSRKADVQALSAALLSEQPQVGSIVGEETAVSAIWEQISFQWPTPARLIRNHQPYMATSRKFNSEVNRLRFGNISDLSEYFDAARQMFIGEVGLQPPTVMFQSRIAENLRSENSLGWFDEDGRVNFKLDIGAIADGWMQIQGVWLHPSLRGQGLAVELLEEALTLVQRRFNVNFCLYVNDFNLPALKAYRKLGFETVSTFKTVFF